MKPGYQALRQSCAWLDISGRTLLRVTGEDRVRLLHALATNAIEGLAPGHGVETFFLDAKGRIQACCTVYAAADHVLIKTAVGRRQQLRDYLDHYIIMDDVAVEDLTDRTAALAIEGPRCADVLPQALGGGQLPANPHGHIELGALRVFRSPSSGLDGFWLALEPDGMPAMIGKLETAGAVAASREDWRVARVENRLPVFGEDYFDTNIPHETGQLALVSFTKGCYVGQEIVERVRSQGRVNRVLTPLAVEATDVPGDTAVHASGREAGNMTSAIVSPAEQRVLGFAILRRQALEAPGGLTVGGCPAQPLPWPVRQS